MIAKFSVIGLDVGNAAGAGGTLESHIVVANGVVARLVFAAVLSPAALIDQHDAASAGGDGQRIVRSPRRPAKPQRNFGTPEPAPVPPAIVPNHIVADHGLE